MAATPAPAFPPLLLSREEVVLVLNLLKADYIFGLEPDPLLQLTPEQAAVGLIYAERALRARDLARVDETGRVVLREAVLLGVGTCVYPQWSLLLHHFSPQGQPTRCFSHRNEKVYVVHTALEGGVLHRFDLLADQEALLAEILKQCGCTELSVAEGAPFKVKGDAIVQAREQAQQAPQASPDAVAEKLVAGGADGAAAYRLAQSLVKPHQISVFHALTQLPENKLAKREVAVIHNTHSGWLMAQAATDADQDLQTVQPVTTASLKTLLQSL